MESKSESIFQVLGIVNKVTEDKVFKIEQTEVAMVNLMKILKVNGVEIDMEILVEKKALDDLDMIGDLLMMNSPVIHLLVCLSFFKINFVVLVNLFSFIHIFIVLTKQFSRKFYLNGF